MPFKQKVIPFAELRDFVSHLKASGKTIVTTNGCFDLLHLGHITYLEQAKTLGDILIVGVNSDSSVRALNKAPDRPLFGERIRAEQVAALESVDFVTIFTDPTPTELIRAANSDIHVKGGDYKGQTLPEETALTEVGGKLILLDLVEGFSTTAMISKIKS